jgi:hypothetical protein
VALAEGLKYSANANEGRSPFLPQASDRPQLKLTKELTNMVNVQTLKTALSGEDERGSGRVQPQQILLDDAELRSLGACDAAFGDAIAYNHPAYLEGYLRELKQRPVDEQGRIIYATAATTKTARWTVAADSSEF